MLREIMNGNGISDNGIQVKRTKFEENLAYELKMKIKMTLALALLQSLSKNPNYPSYAYRLGPPL
jgi:hypothetical protein